MKQVPATSLRKALIGRLETDLPGKKIFTWFPSSNEPKPYIVYSGAEYEPETSSTTLEWQAKFPIAIWTQETGFSVIEELVNDVVNSLIENEISMESPYRLVRIDLISCSIRAEPGDEKGVIQHAELRFESSIEDRETT
jgi:hypothetical protein